MTTRKRSTTIAERYSRVHFHQGNECRNTQVCTTVHQNEFERIRDKYVLHARQLRATCDQGEKAQQLHALNRIMNPMWSNINQQPNEFVRQFNFNHWRDEIAKNEESPSTTIADAIKTSMFVNRLQGEVRSHLLLTSDMRTPDFDKGAKTVEDYYRDVYIDNSLQQVQMVERTDIQYRSTDVYLVTTKRYHEQ
eukprot:5689279-Amphidinium_carterae.2